MDSINRILNNKNVYVDENYSDNVYVTVEDIKKINESSDRHKAIGELLAEKLNKPENIKLYIKLSYLNPPVSLFEWAALATDAHANGKTSDTGKYFYGIARNLGKVK